MNSLGPKKKLYHLTQPDSIPRAAESGNRRDNINIWELIWTNQDFLYLKAQYFKTYIKTSCVCMLSYFHHIWLFATLWTVAHQDPLSMGFSRQEYWRGWCPPPGDLPDPVTEPASLISSALASEFFTTSATWEAHQNLSHVSNCCDFLTNKLGFSILHY